MLLGSVTAMAAGGKTTPKTPVFGTGGSINYFKGNDRGGDALQITSQVAQRFFVKGNLEQVTMRCPSYSNNIGSLTFSLYQWNKDYATTVKGKVLATKVFVDFSDNDKLYMPVSGVVSGDLLLVVSEPVEKVGVWTNPVAASNSAEEIMYVNGTPVEGKAINLTAHCSEVVDLSQTDESVVMDAYGGINLAKSYKSDKITSREATGSIIPDAKNAFACYIVDFGETAPKGATIFLKDMVNDTSKIQIIADNLTGGTLLCEFYLELDEKLTVEREIPAKITHQITGKHVIYLVTENTGMEIFDLKFQKETPGLSWDEIRLSEFEATKDFELKNTYSDTWTATDMLGRKLPDYETVGDYNPDKQVGLFYWTWHGGRDQNKQYSVNQRVINAYNGPESDIKNDYYYAGWGAEGIWNESIYGIYSGFDSWVMRKQLEMFSAAGIDALFFDASNGTNVFTGSYMKLAETMHRMHLEGTRTPGMSFVLPFFDMSYNVTDLVRIYESMYSIGLYSDTWYYWDGKPVIMGYPDSLVKTAQTDEIKAQHQEILDFFTFRPGQPDYIKGQYHQDQWPWLEIYPQHPYGESDKYGCECVSVGVAMNCGDKGLDAMNGTGIYGRSYTYKDRFSKLSDTSMYYGNNFTEQWERAYELNPELVFVTGWNEWVAGHVEKWGKGTAGAYPDTYNDEYSRDIEPTKGALKDTYYYLLASRIRKFKGVSPTPAASAEKTISLSGGFDQWSEVKPEFIGYQGGTTPRDTYLRQGHKPITNYTGRNDIVLSKVARDAENLYFYVQTAEKISPYTDENWMRLFINTDRKYKTGWEGYDFILNRISPDANTATLEKWNGKYITDWKWEYAAKVEYTLSDNEMMIKIPKTVLGIGESVDIEFKWNDNMQLQGDIMDFYVNGDTAPIGRYAYRYVQEGNVKNTPADELVDPTTTLNHITSKFVVMALNNNMAYVYGQRTPIDTQSDVTAPVIINDKTMVPVRFLSESIGATVTWEESTREVTVSSTGKRVKLQLGSDKMIVGKETVNIQAPATEIENRIYVPLRDIVEALGLGCHWVDPGLILVGSGENYVKTYDNGGIIRLLEEYGL